MNSPSLNPSTDFFALSPTPAPHHPTIKIVLASTFEKMYCNVNDLEPDEFAVIKCRTKALKTTGCASCVAIAAHGYSADNELIRIGLQHFFTGRKVENFLQKMTAGKVSKVYLHIYGGYQGLIEDLYEKTIKAAIDGYQGAIEVKTLHLNPWSLTSGWDGYLREINQLGLFSLSMGIEPNGEITIADAKGSLKPAENFTQYADVEHLLNTKKQENQSSQKQGKRRLNEFNLEYYEAVEREFKHILKD